MGKLTIQFPIMIAVALLLCFAFVAAVPSSSLELAEGLQMQRIAPLGSSNVPAPKAGADCGLCVEFMNQALSILIKIAANIGIGGTCADLCGKLPNGLEAKVCDILCEIVGIEALVKALQEIDPDPIYVCEEIKFCEINPNAAANITALTVSPTSGPQGTTFAVDLIFQVTNHIGTGELVLAFQPPASAGQAFGTGKVLVETPPGIYQLKGELQTQPSMSEKFTPGAYLVVGEVCEGTCGSIHAGTKLLSRRNGKFTITQ